VFDNEGFKAVAGGYAHHKAAHNDRPGSVELWPHFQKPEQEKKIIWDRGVDAPSVGSEDRQAAEAIAKDIRRRLEAGSPLACRDGRPISPSDVMILFQRRGQRFRETLRALSDYGVPCAGTDRIAINEDVAVKDLICLLRFAANKDDCFSLAVLLKSPFWGWTDDDLLELCLDRGNKRLWRVLKERAGAEGRIGSMAAIAVEELTSFLDAGARSGPYALLSTALDGGAPGTRTGRARLQARLGSGYREAADAFLEEVLAFEDREPRSIHSFLRYAEGLHQEIKRDVAGDEAPGVRVMTVHGAKGLEAPVVYLGDADYLKARSDVVKGNPLISHTCQNSGISLPILLPSSSKDYAAALADMVADSEEVRLQEYARLLYVAMTRSAEHLIVCGGKEPKLTKCAEDAAAPKTWHQMVEEGLRSLCNEEGFCEEHMNERGCLLRYALGEAAPADSGSTEHEGAFAPPPWLSTPAPKERAPVVLYPSLLGEREEELTGRTAAAPYSSDPRLRGVAIHRLLETLPSFEESEREKIGTELLLREAAALSAEEREQAVAAALTAINDDRLSPIFGKESRGEVAIQGEIAGQMVSGEIDRLVVLPDRVLCAEFKTTRWVPDTEADIPRAHCQQTELYMQLLAKLYPDRAVEGLVVYTAGPNIFRLHQKP
jgi:ATP-dependent helicase/nuclease subunit A